MIRPRPGSRGLNAPCLAFLPGRNSLFGKSQSDRVMVAVGLSPRNNGGERVRVAERRLNRRANQALQASLRDARFLRSLPRAKAHGYRHSLALRGRTGRALAPKN